MAKRKKNKINIKLRFNVLTILIYIVGIILIARLFTLQIIHGEEYKEQSNTRLTRESTIEAARGNFLDRTGVELVTSKMEFSLEMYKSKVDTENLNKAILNMIQVLEKNECSYSDTFPIKINPLEFTIKDQEKLNSWKKTYKLGNNATVEDAFKYFLNRYEVKANNIEDARKIIAIRYRITTEGYSSTRSIAIADNISEKSVSTFSEKNDLYGGLTIVTKATRMYPNGNLASHILGYIGRINGDEYTKKKEEGYLINDNIGRTGIENLFEKYLKGTNGIRQIGMSVDGAITEEYIGEEAIQGSTVVLTIDANLQAVTERALQETINNIREGAYSSSRKKYDATAGAIVVMNVKNGEVLAMASNPDYAPELFVNGISKEKYDEINGATGLLNRTIQRKICTRFNL